MKYRHLPEQPLTTDIRMCEGIFVKHCVFAEGSYIPQHSHASEHLTVIAAGAVRVWADDVLLGDYKAPAGIVITAQTKHLFLALEPLTTVLCIHRVDETGDPTIHEEHHLSFEEH